MRGGKPLANRCLFIIYCYYLLLLFYLLYSLSALYPNYLLPTTNDQLPTLASYLLLLTSHSSFLIPHSSFLNKEFLKTLDKFANMKSIHDSMISMNINRHPHFIALTGHFPEGYFGNTSAGIQSTGMVYSGKVRPW